jgi:hypothetical protein
MGYGWPSGLHYLMANLKKGGLFYRCKTRCALVYEPILCTYGAVGRVVYVWAGITETLFLHRPV